MGITISKVRLNHATISQDKDGIKINGNYSLITDKGLELTKTDFNSYSGPPKFEFEKALGRNFVDEVESTLEIEIGIQEAVKTVLKEVDQ